MKNLAWVAAFLLFLAVSASVAAQDTNAKPANELIVNVSNIQNTDGRIGCTLFSKEDGFPSDAEKADKRVWAQHKSDKATCKFRNVKPGEYAVAVMHDEDKNGELNTSMVGRPQEGWGVSKDVPPRRFGPPKYEDAKLKYTGGQMTIDIKLRY